jgi:hypothetical protein
MPAIVAAGWPNLLEKTNNLMLGFLLISSMIISSVLSGDGSKAKIIS